MRHRILTARRREADAIGCEYVCGLQGRERVSARSATSSRLFGGIGIVCIGIIAAFATNLALTSLTPAKFAFVLGGFALLIPTMVLRDPKAYWLFLLVISIPFDITKSLSIGILDTQTVVKTYGIPASATMGLDVYLTDIILATMLLPWLADVSLRRTTIFFPRVGYLFLFYLAWAFLVSLINARLFPLAVFELFREGLYFTFFVYLINNVSTRLHFRNIVWALILGLIIGAGSVILFFERGIGTDTVTFASLHDQPGPSGPTNSNRKNPMGSDVLTVGSSEGGLGSAGSDKETQLKRSQGMFLHPAIPAGLCGLLSPIVLAYLLSAKRTRDRIILFLVYVWTFVALLLTFSRAGFIGFVASILIFFVIGGRTGFISRRLATLSSFFVTSLVVLSMPVLLVYLETRPDTFFMRFNMFGAALTAYSQHPFLGVGLNNDTAAMKESKQELREVGIPIPAAEPADSYYLAILMGVGPVGSILFFGFFGTIVMIALRASREVAVAMRPLLLGMIAGLAALATQSIADGPLAGHSVSGTLWLFAALIIAIRRYDLAERRLSQAGGRACLSAGL